MKNLKIIMVISSFLLSTEVMGQDGQELKQGSIGFYLGTSNTGSGVFGANGTISLKNKFRIAIQGETTRLGSSSEPYDYHYEPSILGLSNGDPSYESIAQIGFLLERVFIVSDKVCLVSGGGFSWIDFKKPQYETREIPSSWGSFFPPNQTNYSVSHEALSAVGLNLQVKLELNFFKRFGVAIPIRGNINKFRNYSSIGIEIRFGKLK